MLEDIHFQRNTVVHVDAAVVGVSKSRWKAAAPHDSDECVRKTMSSHQFDVLPIQDGKRVRAYFRTKRWNDFSKFERRDITHKDLIHFRTPVREVIKGFAAEERHFYFLGNDGEVVGLITVANLNTRQVKTYLYSLICDLELRLSDYLDRAVDDEALYPYLFGESVKDQSVDLKGTYDAARRDGLEVRLVEYLYLWQITGAMAHFGLHKPLGYSKTKFKDALGSINILRDTVAHPTRSTITAETPVAKLWERLDLIEEVLFKLRQVSDREVAS